MKKITQNILDALEDFHGNFEKIEEYKYKGKAYYIGKDKNFVTLYSGKEAVVKVAADTHTSIICALFETYIEM